MRYLIVALMLLAGCHELPTRAVTRLQAAPDSSISLSVTTDTSGTSYHLTVRGYGSYDRAGGWFVTGNLGGYTLHGVYCGEDVPVALDDLWLSDGCEFYELVNVSISRGTSDFMTITVPSQVLGPHGYRLTLWRMDESGQKAYLIREFNQGGLI